MRPVHIVLIALIAVGVVGGIIALQESSSPYGTISTAAQPTFSDQGGSGDDEDKPEATPSQVDDFTVNSVSQENLAIAPHAVLIQGKVTNDTSDDDMLCSDAELELIGNGRTYQANSTDDDASSCTSDNIARGTSANYRMVFEPDQAGTYQLRFERVPQGSAPEKYQSHTIIVK
jgi:hypothetical protein